MARLPLLNRRDLTPADRSVYDEIAESRGHAANVFRAMLHSPGAACRVARLGAHLRYESELPPAWRELAILTTARRLGCDYEWAYHEPLARDAGVSPATIEAVRAGEHGSTALSEQEQTVAAYAVELLHGSPVTGSCFDRARVLLGDAGLTDLTILVGYYQMLALLLSAYQVEPEQRESRGPV